MKSCPRCRGLYPSSFSLCPKDGTSLVHVSELPEGSLLRGKYEILAKLGQGGMGVVYKARHLHFDELRAVKVVGAHLLEDEEFLDRFRTEAVIMRRIRHPHAVLVEDFDETEDGRPFIVMEYVEGESLEKRLSSGPLPPALALRIAAQVATALDAAHLLSVLHRDIKPSNILLTFEPTRGTGTGELNYAKVLDFGVAKIKEGSPLLRGTSLTRTGFAIGTPEYMSPEQAQGTPGQQLDPRADLYSLGVVLYEMLTGELPFTADTPIEMLLHHVQTPPRNPLELAPQLPSGVVALVLRALAKNPADRFPTGGAMQKALDASLRDAAVWRLPAPTAPTARYTSSSGAAADSEPASGASPKPALHAGGRPPAARLGAQRAAVPPEPVPPAKSGARSRSWLYAGVVVALFLTVSLGVRLFRTEPNPPPESPAQPGQEEARQPNPTVPTPTLPTATPPQATSTPTSPPAAPAATTDLPAHAIDEKIRELLQQGWRALRTGEVVAANRAFRAVLALDPNNREAQEGLRLLQPEHSSDQKIRQLLIEARQAMERGDYDAATRHFETILEIDPTHRLAKRGLEKVRQARDLPASRRRR